MRIDAPKNINKRKNYAAQVWKSSAPSKKVYRVLKLTPAQQAELGTYSEVLSFLESTIDSIDEIKRRYDGIELVIVEGVMSR